MNNTIKGAIIIALGIIVAASIQTYFSPYQGCIRGVRTLAKPDEPGAKPGYAEALCASQQIR
jgi:hypothetical protein